MSHAYATRTVWTGNTGQGTAAYRSYNRSYLTQASGKADLPGSADPAVSANADATLYNPEELLVASASACHMLWFLHLASSAGILVTAYVDDAEGHLDTTPDGSGSFREVVLRPRIELADPSRKAEADHLHHKAHELCYIARSLNCLIRIEPQ